MATNGKRHGGTVSPAEYARRRGVSRQSVYQGIAAGRIPLATGDGRGKRIDPAEADAAWPEFSDDVGGGRPKADGSPAVALPQKGNAHRDGRGLRIEYQGKLAKLAFEKQSGKLIDASEVEQSAFLVARTVRDAMLNIPDRVAHMLAGQTDAKAIHQTLTAEILQVLGDLSAAIKDVGKAALGGAAAYDA